MLTSSLTNSSNANDFSILPITEDIPLTSRSKPSQTTGEDSHTTPYSPYDELRKEFPELYPEQSSSTAQPHHNPWPDTPPARNPWYLRPNAFHVPIRLPMPLSPIYIPSLNTEQDNKAEGKQKRSSVNRLSAGYAALSGSSTTILPPSNSPTCPLPPIPTPMAASRQGPSQSSRNKQKQKELSPEKTHDRSTTSNDGGVPTVLLLRKPAAPWSPFASDHKNTTLGVDTRVWSQKDNNGKAHATSSIQDSPVSRNSSRVASGPQLSPPPSYSVAVYGESSFASTSTSDNISPPEREPIGTVLGHPQPPRDGVVKVETHIASEVEVIGGRRHDDWDSDDGKQVAARE